jgi:hypothetical protein
MHIMDKSKSDAANNYAFIDSQKRKYSSLLNKVAPGRMIFLNRSKKKLERI